jgi:hypothetical protein
MDLSKRLEALENRVEALESRQPGTGDLVGEEDWPRLSEVFAALGHPMRLLLLSEVLAGRSTAAQLRDHEALGTTGQLYHHLRQLVGAGWLHVTGRGLYAVPESRVQALCSMIRAARRDGPEPRPDESAG